MSEAVSDLPGALEVSWIRNNLSKFKDVFIEKGATWIEERHKVIQAVCKHFGLTLREQTSEGVTLYLDNEKSYSNDELMKHPTYGPNTRMFIEKIDYLAKLYDDKVLKPSAEGKEDTKMLI